MGPVSLAVFCGSVVYAGDPTPSEVLAIAESNATKAKNLHLKWIETFFWAQRARPPHPNRTEVELWLRDDGAFRLKRGSEEKGWGPNTLLPPIDSEPRPIP